MISLMDLAEHEAVSWYLVYQNCVSVKWWNCWLRPGFQHVQLWQLHRFGPSLHDQVWVFVDPCMELVKTGVFWNATPPWELMPTCVVQHVRRLTPRHRVRERFYVGPITCVELVKAFIGLKSRRVRTPYQLYRYLRRESLRSK